MRIPPPRFCHQCGAQVPLDARYCARCGTALPAVAPTAAAQAAPGRRIPLAAIVVVAGLAVCGLGTMIVGWAVSSSGSSGSRPGVAPGVRTPTNAIVRRSPTTRPSTSHQVVYRARHSNRQGGAFSITYENAQGGTEQKDLTNLGTWEQSYQLENGAFVYLSIQNSLDAGSVTCEIVVDGRVWKTSTSSGAYVIADCSGSIGSD